MPEKALSALILTKNESQSIKRCLNSVSWADEIIVIDDFSSDNTVEICRTFGAKVYQNHYDYYGQQSSWGLSHCSHNWVYQIDADEECTPELAEEIKHVLKKSTSFDAFLIPIRGVFMNKVIRYGTWGTKKRVRLFNKNKAEYSGPKNHESIKVPGKVGKLKGFYLHHTFSTMDDWIKKQVRYAEYGSDSACKRGDSAGFVNLFLHPLFHFTNAYFRRLGFLDGYRGLIIAGHGAMTVFLRYCYLYERYWLEQKK